MALNIKSILADALLELCETKEFKNITIQNLQQKTGLSRSAFYNHFKDKNDLVQWIYYNYVLCNFKEVNIEANYYENLVAYYQLVEKYHRFLKSALKVNEQNCLREYMYAHPFEWEQKYHEKWCRENQVNDSSEEELQFFTKYHVLASVGMTIDWIMEDMPISSELMAKRIAFLKQVGFSQILNDQEQNIIHPYK
ncbi:MAG: TetR/AcrR family transcriptional regulator [Floccifex porci]|uniref:TetR/AcrR family transcriptional regulator n=1 Tax=Floccifex porci TaxID=2606629 RepID=UPI003EFDF46C